MKSKLANLKNKIVSLWHVFAFICFLIILLICFYYTNNRIIVLLLTIFFSISLLVLFNFFMKFKYREKVVLPLILILMFIVYVYLGNKLRVNPSWDFGTVYSEAVEMIQNGSKHITNINYFLKYTNNQPYFFVLYILFSISSLLGIKDFLSVGIIFNAFLIVLSLGIFYECVKEIWNKKIAFFGLILSFFCVGYLLYVPIFYTDTFPLPLMNTIMLLYIKVYKKEVKKEYIIMLAISILVGLGFELKATVVILLVAIMIHILFKFNVKKSLIFIVIMTMGFLGTLKSYDFIFNSTQLLQYTQEEYERYNFPYTHWVMMGLRNPGGFNVKDRIYTQGLPNLKTRKTETKKEINRRLKNYGVCGLFNHLCIKINYTWSDGSFFGSKLLARKPIENGSLIQKIVVEGMEFNDAFSIIVNSFEYSIIFFVIISLFFGIRENNLTIISCFRLALFGLFVFLLIWESKSKYLVNFIPVIYIVAIDGIYKLYKYKEKRNQKCVD